MDDRPKGQWDREPEDGDDPLDEGLDPATSGREPVFNMPGGILLALMLLVMIYALTGWILSDEISNWIMVEFGFSPVRYVYDFSNQDLAWLWTPFTYSLLHGSIEHLGFNGLWLAAFGTPVWRRIGAVRFWLFWLATSAAGAVAHVCLNWGDASLLIGASGVISGLMGAACRFAFGPGRSGLRLREQDAFPPRLSVLASLSERTVLVFIVMFLAGNLIIAFGIPLVGDPGAAIAWDAHLGGFTLGFLGFALFDRRPIGKKSSDI
ncbi:rhomboid family intramembrane serine protease [Agrobacterium vitis]|uniref:rhomboid family intramembrane serine protease n=1 Tax=Agrobacterium vitis TaxID=373 RepID=UPI0015D80238|nr:rhomboid family intramembrane serine protease [Agrobacterium vitis]BCH59601.1 rhomboid family intramembrane serine protease [Agrobacterium vitis]